MASRLVASVLLCVIDVLINLRQASRGDVGGGLRCGHDAGDGIVARQSVANHKDVLFERLIERRQT